MMSQFSDYMSQLPGSERAEYERIGALVRRLVPQAEESWSYGIPTYMYMGKPLIGFRSAKKHLSIFPYGKAPVQAVLDELSGFSTSSGTIRFTVEKPLPDSVIEKLVRFKQREIDGE